MTQRNFVIPEILHQDVQNYLGSKPLPGMEKYCVTPSKARNLKTAALCCG